KVTQTERGNDALIDQIGHYGKATIDQETNLGKQDVNNKAYIFQTSMDPGVQPSAMPRNEAKIAQNGNRQEAQIEQMYGGHGKNYANIRQDDWNNLSGQPGVNNQLAHVKQVGHRNTANVEQDGTVGIHSLNEVVVNQMGEDNWAKTKQMNVAEGVNTISLVQNDDFNWANIDQDGTDLEACVEQNGTGMSVGERNRVLITQTGEGSVAEYEQHGNSNYAKLNQSGMNNYSNVYQNGTGHTSTVTQTGM
ncbi:MAG: hypothetical protein MI866_06940, partial [Bacteroidales bacterium]|nr:hypothetical protein [Bacteroidales bacterium]